MIKLKQKKGFSMSEVIVAIMVFTVGVLSVVEVFPLYRKMSRISEKSSVAVFLAQEQVENIFSQSYDSITVGQFEVKHAVAASGEFAPYQRKTDVSYVDGSYQNSAADVGLKKVITTVYWDEDGSEKSTDLVSLISAK